MKKAILTFAIAAIIVIAAVIWFLTSGKEISFKGILEILVIFIVVAFAVFAGYKRMTSALRGEPAEDELSKKVMLKTASWSFYISIYLWLAVMYFSDKVKWETHTLIGAGILAMAVVFAVCWLIFNFRGIRNE